MKPILRIIQFICLFSFLFSNHSYSQRQTQHSFLSKFGPNAYVGYYAYVPKDYVANPSKNYPLLIFLHGTGEKSYMATDSTYLSKVLTHGPPKLIEAGMDFPFIVISPQCPFGDWENVTTDGYQTSVKKPGEFVDEILETMKKLYRVDLNKVYFTGLSMGSAATWTYMMEHPEKVAAAIPISGWIDDPSNACNIAKNNIPVWAFQSEDDPKTIGTPGFINYINQCDPAPSTPAKITLYPGKEHDAWTVTYNNTGAGIAPDNIYNWLMRQSKNSTINSYNPLIEDDQTLRLYPIPAKSSLKIKYMSKIAETIQLNVYSQDSRIVLEKSINVNNGNNIIELEVSSLQNGFYSLTILGSSRTTKKSLIISR